MNIDVDTDTLHLLEIAAHFLQRYFDHSKTEAIADIEFYYQQWRDIHDVDMYHHMGAFEIAVRVQYFVRLGGNQDDYLQWKHSNGLNEMPSEAAEYFRQHYFHK